MLNDSCFNAFKSCSAVVRVSFQYVSCALIIFDMYFDVFVSYFLSLWPQIPFSHLPFHMSVHMSSVSLFLCCHTNLRVTVTVRFFYYQMHYCVQ